MEDILEDLIEKGKIKYMNFRKIISWLLLFVGVIIIFYSLYSSYNIFTGNTAAPEIFKIAENKEAPLPQKDEVQNLEIQIEKLISEQLKEMLPADFLPKLFNLIAWSMMASILIFGGAQISGLGIKLMKND